ncbi:MAG TPA: ATP-binding protein [Limnobacter sp.]|nr:ATP-binding protein [Limnobacter sp.]
MLTTLSINNYLGISTLNVELAPVTVFYGANGQGKSSIRNGIIHALTGEFERVKLKKELVLLLHNKEKSGSVAVLSSKGDASITLPSGSGSALFTEPVAQLCLRPERFMALAASERRTALSVATKTKLGAKDAMAMLAKDHPKEVVDRIGPMLAAGFEAAHKEAQAVAREHKAIWKRITGEEFGTEKAKDWAPAPVQVPNSQRIDNLRTERARLAAHIATLQQSAGAAQQMAKERGALEQELIQCVEKGERFARIQDKLHVDERELAKLNASPLVNIDTGLLGHFAWYVSGLVQAEYIDPSAIDDAQNLLAQYEAAHGAPVNPATCANAADRAKHLEAVALMERAIANGKRDLTACEAAIARADQVRNRLDEIAGLNTQNVADLLADADNELKAVTSELTALEAAQKAADDWEKIRTDAQAEYLTVVQWMRMIESLAPTGLPALLTQQIIDPVNNAMKALTDSVEWPTVRIDENMEVWFLGRHYALLSESEQYRCTLVMGLALAQLTDTRIITMDRLDVLTTNLRADALELAEIAQCQGIFFCTTLQDTMPVPTEWAAFKIQRGTLATTSNQEIEA